MNVTKSNQNLNMAKLAIDKSLCKEYIVSNERVVYLNNGTEFQIQLFNTTRDTIGAELTLNGKRMPNYLVLKPGERVWLSRYLDEPVKFKFSTYEVEVDDETRAIVEDAIKNNGELTVKFYKEKEKPQMICEPLVYTNGNSWLNHNHNYGSPYAGEVRYRGIDSSALTKGINLHNELATFSVEPSSLNCNVNDVVTNTVLTSSKIETGRVEKGGYSNQHFYTVNIDFEYFPFRTETIKILPMSQKRITANDLTKVYCINCGKKLKSNYKFCPKCGTKIE